MDDDKPSPYKNGYWTWNDELNTVQFNSRDIVKEAQRMQSLGSMVQPHKTVFREIKFNEHLDTPAQAKFRKYLRRKVKIIESNVVTIQDLKDIVIYIADVKDLTPEFISYFHSEKIDKFLRSLIVYFHYYFQVWDFMTVRREEARRKLRQPLVTILENVVRDNIADLRSVMARDYSYIILGLPDTEKFYHLKNESISLSEKDRILFESLLTMAARVVWVALQRKYLTLIELEICRSFRTDFFNTSIHRGMKSDAFTTLPEEDRVLIGDAFEKERILLHRSPNMQELIFGEHDYKLLATGILDIDTCGERLKHLEIAYSAPEERLLELQVGVGILGFSRDEVDTMLVPKKIITKTEVIPAREIQEFIFPEDTNPVEEIIRATLPETPCQFTETLQTKKARNTQCKMWRKYVEMNGEVSRPAPAEIISTDTSSVLKSAN